MEHVEILSKSGRKMIYNLNIMTSKTKSCTSKLRIAGLKKYGNQPLFLVIIVHTSCH